MKPIKEIKDQLLEEIRLLKTRKGFLTVGFQRLAHFFIKREKRYLLEEIKTLKDIKGFLRGGKPRFDRLFGRDSLIAAWQLLDWNPGIAKATLEILSHFQGKVFHDEREEEPGKILHETDLKAKWHSIRQFPFPYYGSVDSTPLFLIIFSLYFKKTRDWKFLEGHWKNILMALQWMEECGDRDKDYFLEYERKNPKGLFHQGWKDSFTDHLKIAPPVAIVEVQGYQYLSLQEIAKIAEARKDFDLAERLRERAQRLKEEFNKKFWMEDKKYFALALDGQKNQRKAVTSNPGHLLFTGIIEKDKIKAVVQRLFEPDLWTDYGIRTHSIQEPDFDFTAYHLGTIWPHDNWIIAQGLKKLGFQDKYSKIKKATLRAYQEMGFLPEYYGVKENKIIQIGEACYPQAWATGALFNFLGFGLSFQEKIIESLSEIFH
jgi:glycogen debranching enzyme